MTEARSGHTATALPDGRVVLAGVMATARHKHDAVRLADGRVLVLGGADRTDRHDYASTEVYNLVTASFEAGPSMASSRYKIQGTAVLLANGEWLYTFGG